MIKLLSFAISVVVFEYVSANTPPPSLCGTGKQQSPIDIQPSKATVVDSLEFVLKHLDDATAGGQLTNYEGLGKKR